CLDHQPRIGLCTELVDQPATACSATPILGRSDRNGDTDPSGAKVSGDVDVAHGVGNSEGPIELAVNRKTVDQVLLTLRGLALRAREALSDLLADVCLQTQACEAKQLIPPEGNLLDLCVGFPQRCVSSAVPNSHPLRTHVVERRC